MNAGGHAQLRLLFLQTAIQTVLQKNKNKKNKVYMISVPGSSNG